MSLGIPMNTLARAIDLELEMLGDIAENLIPGHRITFRDAMQYAKEFESKSDRMFFLEKVAQGLLEGFELDRTLTSPELQKMGITAFVRPCGHFYEMFSRITDLKFRVRAEG
jgi:hypothetical protein